MLRAQPSLCAAVSHAGSRISCCECFLSSLTSSEPFHLIMFFPLSSPVFFCKSACCLSGGESLLHNFDSRFHYFPDSSHLLVFFLSHFLLSLPSPLKSTCSAMILLSSPSLGPTQLWLWLDGWRAFSDNSQVGREMLSDKQLYTAIRLIKRNFDLKGNSTDFTHQSLFTGLRK